jgi:sugar O-acyltransferase (sialic acid O-acetyltransferase NeuD family)
MEGSRAITMKNNRIVIIGAGGQSSVLQDIARGLDIESIILNDTDGLISATDTFDNRRKYNNDPFIVGIGDNQIREQITKTLESEGFHLGSLIHSSAVIASSASVESGSCVMAGAVVNNHVHIGKGVIVNTKSSIDHHSVIGDYTHVAPGSTIAGQCKVGERCLIGAGAVISIGISICDDVIVGAGGVVIKDIVEPGTYVGVPVVKVK